MDGTLTEELISTCISELGRSATGLSFVFTKLDIAGRNLNNVDILIQYKYLQSINASHNAIQSLQPGFQNLTSLVTLDVSFNEIEQLLEFEPNELIYANYSNNRITSIVNLKPFLFLRTLNISNNKLTSLEGIDALKNLTDLDCSQNSIASTSPGFRSLPLQKLYMQNNCVGDIIDIPNEAMVILNLASNKIKTLEDFAGRYSLLTSLDLADNPIVAPEEVTHLAGLPLLRDLYFQVSEEETTAEQNVDQAEEKTPEEKVHYKWIVLNLCRQISILNGIEVTPEEKVKAANLFGEDIPERQQILDKYFGPQQ